jgi:hypothetical protein
MEGFKMTNKIELKNGDYEIYLNGFRLHCVGNSIYIDKYGKDLFSCDLSIGEYQVRDLTIFSSTLAEKDTIKKIDLNKVKSTREKRY